METVERERVHVRAGPRVCAVIKHSFNNTIGHFIMVYHEICYHFISIFYEFKLVFNEKRNSFDDFLEHLISTAVNTEGNFVN